jgi:hypothetical protein
MGSESIFVNPVEAAQILGVSVDQVHTLHRKGFLEASYPEGRRPHNLAGKRFRREDVLTLKELRAQCKGASPEKLQQLALQAIVVSKRVERRLNELTHYLGLTDSALSLEKERVIAFFTRVSDFVEEPRIDSPQEAIDWARQLLGVTEEFLELVALHTQEAEPWKVFLEAGKRLAAHCSTGTQARTYVDHARRNLRNAAYMYVRGEKGVRAADRLFPLEGYSNELIQTMFPTH